MVRKNGSNNEKKLDMRKYINFWTYLVFSCMSMLTWSGCSDEVLLQDETIEKKETFRLTVSQEQKNKSRLAFNEDFLTSLLASVYIGFFTVGLVGIFCKPSFLRSLGISE